MWPFKKKPKILLTCRILNGQEQQYTLYDFNNTRKITEYSYTVQVEASPDHPELIGRFLYYKGRLCLLENGKLTDKPFIVEWPSNTWSLES